MQGSLVIVADVFQTSLLHSGPRACPSQPDNLFDQTLLAFATQQDMANAPAANDNTSSASRIRCGSTAMWFPNTSSGTKETLAD